MTDGLEGPLIAIYETDVIHYSHKGPIVFFRLCDSLVEVLGEDKVGRSSRQRDNASDVGGVGDADAHGFTHHQVAFIPAGS